MCDFWCPRHQNTSLMLNAPTFHSRILYCLHGRHAPSNPDPHFYIRAPFDPKRGQFLGQVEKGLNLGTYGSVLCRRVHTMPESTKGGPLRIAERIFLLAVIFRQSRKSQTYAEFPFRAIRRGLPFVLSVIRVRVTKLSPFWIKRSSYF